MTECGSQIDSACTIATNRQLNFASVQSGWEGDEKWRCTTHPLHAVDEPLIAGLELRPELDGVAQFPLRAASLPRHPLLTLVVRRDLWRWLRAYDSGG